MGGVWDDKPIDLGAGQAELIFVLVDGVVDVEATRCRRGDGGSFDISEAVNDVGGRLVEIGADLEWNGQCFGGWYGPIPANDIAVGGVIDSENVREAGHITSFIGSLDVNVVGVDGEGVAEAGTPGLGGGVVGHGIPSAIFEAILHALHASGGIGGGDRKRGGLALLEGVGVVPAEAAQGGGGVVDHYGDRIGLRAFGTEEVDGADGVGVGSIGKRGRVKVGISVDGVDGDTIAVNAVLERRRRQVPGESGLFGGGAGVKVSVGDGLKPGTIPQAANNILRIVKLAITDIWVRGCFFMATNPSG